MWVGETLWVIVGLLDSASSVDNSVMILPFGDLQHHSGRRPLGPDAPGIPCAVPSTKSSDYAHPGVRIQHDRPLLPTAWVARSPPISNGAIRWICRLLLPKATQLPDRRDSWDRLRGVPEPTEKVAVAITAAQDGGTDHYTPP